MAFTTWSDGDILYAGSLNNNFQGVHIVGYDATPTTIGSLGAESGCASFTIPAGSLANCRGLMINIEGATPSVSQYSNTWTPTTQYSYGYFNILIGISGAEVSRKTITSNQVFVWNSLINVAAGNYGSGTFSYFYVPNGSEITSGLRVLIKGNCIHTTNLAVTSLAGNLSYGSSMVRTLN